MNNVEQNNYSWIAILKTIAGATSDGEAPVLELGQCDLPLYYHYFQIHYDWGW